MNNHRSIPRILFRSLLLSYMLSGLMVLGLAYALYKLKLPEQQTNMAVLSIYCTACLIGGLISGKAAESHRFFWGLLLGILYFAVLSFISFVLSCGELPELSDSMSILACCSAGGMIGGMIS